MEIGSVILLVRTQAQVWTVARSGRIKKNFIVSVRDMLKCERKEFNNILFIWTDGHFQEGVLALFMYIIGRQCKPALPPSASSFPSHSRLAILFPPHALGGIAGYLDGSLCRKQRKPTLARQTRQVAFMLIEKPSGRGYPIVQERGEVSGGCWSVSQR